MQYVCRGSLARGVGLCYVCCSSVVVVSKLIQHQSRAITIIFVAHTVIFENVQQFSAQVMTPVAYPPAIAMCLQPFQ